MSNQLLLPARRGIVASAIVASLAIAAIAFGMSTQDKYTLKVPGGLAFSEFKGYEGWPVVAISENGGLISVILGKRAMIDAFRAGAPGNGKPFPDGARMAKIIEPQKERGVPWSTDRAEYTARYRLHGEG